VFSPREKIPVIARYRGFSTKRKRFSGLRILIRGVVATAGTAAGAAIAEEILGIGNCEFLKIQNDIHWVHLLSTLGLHGVFYGTTGDCWCASSLVHVNEMVAATSHLSPADCRS